MQRSDEIDKAVSTGAASDDVETMDVDLTPPKKRVKSAQISRQVSVEGDMTRDTAADAHHITKQRVSSTSGLAAAGSSATTEPEIKIEPVAGAPLSASLPAHDTTPVAVKAESDLLGVTAEPPIEADDVPAPKKKKTTSASSKSKKGSSTKKASASTSAHAESSTSSRTKVKVEEKAPPAAAPGEEEEEEEDDALYCICKRRQDDIEGGMIACDRCDQWYHYRCMEITEDDAELVDRFVCPPCHEFTPERTTYKAACARAGCRHAAQTPFSQYCSDRCGVLALSARLAGLKVNRNKQAAAMFEADPRVVAARKTEALTQRTDAFYDAKGEWDRVVAAGLSEGATDAAVQRLGLSGAFALMRSADSAQPFPIANGTDPAAANDESAEQAPANAEGPTSDASSATSLIGLAEQLRLVTRQIAAVDLEKTQINGRLDRLDLRSTLLHLVSDRVPTLVAAPSTSAPEATDAAEDEEMPDEARSKTKKKKTTKGRSKDADAGSGPLCGYDQRLHWDDPDFDAWAHTDPGRSMLAHDAPLDGELDDPAGPNAVVCATVKRKCRRHIDWSNLCELALDAEKAALAVQSRILTHSKLELAAAKDRLHAEYEAVQQLAQQQRDGQKKAAEQRDRDMALAVAAHGTRRAAV